MTRNALWDDAVDLTGYPPVLGEAAAPSTVAVAGLAALRHRADALALFRESNEYDTVLMRGLIEHTLSYCGALRSVDLAREIELAPLTNPDFRKPGVEIVLLVYGRARAALVEIGNEYYLYSMTSAARSNSAGENDWSQLLVQVLKALRPRDLYAASLSRLVRAFEHQATVLHAVSRNVDRVHAGSTVITMSGEGSETGQVMWSTLAMVAASERNLIVQRLTAGVVAKYRRGEWIKGDGAVVPGYLMDPATGSLRVDTSMIPAIQRMWASLSDPRISSHQIVADLGEAGYTTPTARKRHGAHATVADLRYPDVFVRRVLRWAPTYLTGTHETRWTNPFKGARHIAGLPVQDASDDDPGYLVMRYDWGRLPVDPVLINTALRVRAVPQARDTSSGAAPLHGQNWVQDGLESLIIAGTSEDYYLRVRGATR